jgi:outer membrane biosynthesis protein TonB
MRRSAAYSAVLHVAILALVYFGLPTLFESDESVNQPIPVAVYTVAEETTLPPAAPEPEPEPEPAQEPPPPPEPAKIPEPTPAPVVEKTSPPTPTPEPEPEPETTPEPLPSPLKAEPDPTTIPPPPPPKPVQVAKAQPDAKTEAKPKPKPEPDPVNFDSLLVNLASKPEKQRPPEEDAANQEAKPEAVPEVTAATRRAPEVRNEPLSLSVIDAIRRQVEDKWNVPIGARDVESLSVELRIVLQTNGKVHDVQIVDRERMRRPGEENFRAMAESAERAVWRASPLQQLPPEKYDQWQEITLIFKPPV